MRLKNKVAMVTGAAGGIGSAVSQAMAKEGARVVIADIDQLNGKQISDAILEQGGEALFVACDVTSEREVRYAVEQTVEQYGKIDVLHNNAAIALNGMITDLEEERWNKVINTNLSSVFRGCKYAIQYMLESGGGSIINTASVQGHVGFSGWPAYAAAKGGIISLTRNLAVEYAPNNIRVNSISPGTIRTPMLDQVMREAADSEALLRDWTNLHPIGRIGEMEEVAAAVVFLASDESSFITGEDLRIDGGSVVKP